MKRLIKLSVGYLGTPGINNVYYNVFAVGIPVIVKTRGRKITQKEILDNIPKVEGYSIDSEINAYVIGERKEGFFPIQYYHCHKSKQYFA